MARSHMANGVVRIPGPVASETRWMSVRMCPEFQKKGEMEGKTLQSDYSPWSSLSGFLVFPLSLSVSDMCPLANQKKKRNCCLAPVCFS